MTGDHPGPLGRAATRGFAITALERWASRGVTLIVFIVLARLLDTEDFGLVALAAVFAALASLLVDQGLGDALVQRADLDEHHPASALYLNLAVAAILTVTMQLAAEPVARLMDEPRLASVLRWISINFILAGASSAPKALLRRSMRFGAISALNAAGVITGGITGVAMAFGGAGVWALVGQLIVTNGVTTVGLWIAVGRLDSWRFSRSHLMDLLPVSAAIALNGGLGFVNRRLDDFLVGAVLGSVALGYYNVAYRVLLMFTELLIVVGMQVALPTFVKMRGNRPRIRAGLDRATRMSALLAFPAFLGIAALAPEITVVVFGERWLPSASVVRILASVGVIHAVSHFHMPALLAVNRQASVVRLTLMHVVGNVIAFSIAVQWGIVAVALGYAIRAVLLTPFEVVPLARYVGVRPRSYFLQFAFPLGASVSMAVFVRLVAELLNADASVAGLSLLVATGAAFYLLVVVTFGREWWHEARSYLAMLARSGASVTSGSLNSGSYHTEDNGRPIG